MEISKPQQIIILGTGGTIAGQAEIPEDSVNYTAAVVDISQLVDSAKLTHQYGAQSDSTNTILLSEQLVQVDSKDMSFEIWKRLLSRCQDLLLQDQVQAIVITHGTDTIEETAYFLHVMLHTEKPVILTCAMRPANAPDSDGPQNLNHALYLATQKRAKGVMVVCAGEVHSGQSIQKIHTTRLNAFSSGDDELIGRFVEGKLQLSMNTVNNQVQQTQDLPHLYISDLERFEQPPRVEVIMNHADANGLIVEALLQQNVSQQQKLRGIVVAGTGNGTISTSLESALLRAQKSGVVIWRSTRCVYGKLDGKANAIFGDSHGLSPVKARIALMLNLIRSDLLAVKS
ncbi:MAG TPA: asparaginase [Burkholderiaceae bacterium]|nr:asparaginase [Burkholderiaceae bacterium]